MDANRFLTIHYLGGETETFTFAKQAGDQYDQMNKLHNAMKVDRIVIEAEGRLHIIPLSAIKRLEFSPLPEQLPDGIIKGAMLNDTY